MFKLNSGEDWSWCWEKKHGWARARTRPKPREQSVEKYSPGQKGLALRPMTSAGFWSPGAPEHPPFPASEILIPSHSLLRTPARIMMRNLHTLRSCQVIKFWINNSQACSTPCEKRLTAAGTNGINDGCVRRAVQP